MRPLQVNERVALVDQNDGRSDPRNVALDVGEDHFQNCFDVGGREAPHICWGVNEAKDVRQVVRLQLFRSAIRIDILEAAADAALRKFRQKSAQEL
jgi:hypothetical protein